MFTAPTAFRSIKKEDPQGKFFAQYDLEKFRTLFLAGERADPDTLVWAEKLLKRPVIDHWWQTETGWAITGNPVGLGRFDGGDARPRRTGGRRELQGSAANTLGSIVVKLPLAPACLPTLWQQDGSFEQNTSTSSPAITRPPTPASRTKR